MSARCQDRPGGRSRHGGGPTSAAPGRPGPPSPATARPTSASSAPATPACGPRTTCSAPTRRCASSCSSASSPASAPRAATAAGCSAAAHRRRAQRDGTAREAAIGAAARRSARPSTRSRAVVPTRGHRLRLRQGRHARRRPDARRSCAPARRRGERRGSATDDALLDARRGRRARPRRRRCSAPRFTPHCARVHPAKLVRGLAAAVERPGATIYERTPVTGIAPARRARTAQGTVRARWSCAPRRATPPACPACGARCCRCQLDDRHRAARRRRLGADRLGAAARRSTTPRTPTSTPSARPTAASPSAGAASRTASARAPTATGGSPRHGRASCAPPARSCSRRLRDARDRPRLARRARRRRATGLPPSLDRATGLALGRRLRRRRRRDAEPRRAHAARPHPRPRHAAHAPPWVGPAPARWEPEPLRWLAVQTVYGAFRAADALEDRTGKPSRLAGAAGLWQGAEQRHRGGSRRPGLAEARADCLHGGKAADAGSSRRDDRGAAPRHAPLPSMPLYQRRAVRAGVARTDPSAVPVNTRRERLRRGRLMGVPRDRLTPTCPGVYQPLLEKKARRLRCESRSARAMNSAVVALPWRLLAAQARRIR